MRSSAAALAVMCALAAVMGGAAASLTGAEEQTAHLPVSAPIGQVTEESSGQTPFLLRLENGRVVVHRTGEEAAVVLVTDIRAQDLPAADRALLEQGIAAPSYEALLGLLEDFDA